MMLVAAPRSCASRAPAIASALRPLAPTPGRPAATAGPGGPRTLWLHSRRPLASSIGPWRFLRPAGRSYSTAPDAPAVQEPTPLESEGSNVSPGIQEKIGKNLHRKKGHPLNLIKTAIEDHFSSTHRDAYGKPVFEFFDNLDPKVLVKDNFDDLLIPPDHPSRSPNDTFFLTENTVLRTHTSAHQNHFMKAGKRAFLVFGDVYRRDTIDATHYPVFHQVEGVRLFEPGADKLQVATDLKTSLEGLVDSLFGKVQKRWVDAYFPFTEPSYELEIFWNNEWLEVLGSGVIHSQILKNCNLADRNGWAFGVGLERLAMVLFSIPDIRLFWSDDNRFLGQFANARDVHKLKFVPYSKFPPCPKDMTFWLSPKFHENSFFALVREVAGDLVESVKLVDSFTKPSTGQVSHCYRIVYRSMDRSLTNEEINRLQEQVRRAVVHELGVKLR